MGERGDVLRVYVVQHEYWRQDEELDDDPESKMIGVFSTVERADAAIHLLRQQPGFCDWPDAFITTVFRVGVLARPPGG